MEKRQENIPSFETLPPETLLEIAEQHLSLESLVHLTKVSARLAGVAYQLLYSPRYWAKTLAAGTDVERLGLEPVESDSRLKRFYRVSTPVLNFINENISRLRYVGLRTADEKRHIWRYTTVYCRSSVMAQTYFAERVKSRHEPCWETGWCECTGGCQTGRPSRPFHEIENDKEYGCCARKFRL